MGSRGCRGRETWSGRLCTFLACRERTAIENSRQKLFVRLVVALVASGALHDGSDNDYTGTEPHGSSPSKVIVQWSDEW